MTQTSLFRQDRRGTVEWYTPPDIIAGVRSVLGGIDLDPASSAAANRTVQATQIHTSETDGLAHEWAGRVYMNPPYTAGFVDRFVDKLVTSPDVTAWICLVNAATETRWCQRLMRAADAVTFLDGRVRFITTSGVTAGTPLQGQLLAYRGPDVEAFASTFNGVCFLGPIRPSALEPLTAEIQLVKGEPDREASDA